MSEPEKAVAVEVSPAGSAPEAPVQAAAPLPAATSPDSESAGAAQPVASESASGPASEAPPVKESRLKAEAAVFVPSFMRSTPAVVPSPPAGPMPTQGGPMHGGGRGNKGYNDGYYPGGGGGGGGGPYQVRLSCANRVFIRLGCF